MPKVLESFWREIQNLKKDKTKSQVKKQVHIISLVVYVIQSLFFITLLWSREYIVIPFLTIYILFFEALFDLLNT